MEIKTVKFANYVEIPDEYKMTYPKTFSVCDDNRVYREDAYPEKLKFVKKKRMDQQENTIKYMSE